MLAVQGSIIDLSTANQTLTANLIATGADADHDVSGTHPDLVAGKNFVVQNTEHAIESTEPSFTSNNRLAIVPPIHVQEFGTPVLLREVHFDVQNPEHDIVSPGYISSWSELDVNNTVHEQKADVPGVVGIKNIGVSDPIHKQETDTPVIQISRYISARNTQHEMEPDNAIVSTAQWVYARRPIHGHTVIGGNVIYGVSFGYNFIARASPYTMISNLYWDDEHLNRKAA